MRRGIRSESNHKHNAAIYTLCTLSLCQQGLTTEDTGDTEFNKLKLELQTFSKLKLELQTFNKLKLELRTFNTLKL